MSTPTLISKENINEILDSVEQEIRLMMLENGIGTFETRILQVNATLLELVKYLKNK